MVKLRGDVALCMLVAYVLQLPRVLIYAVHGDAVVAPVGGVEELSRWVDVQVGGVVYPVEARREGGERLQLREDAGLAVVAERGDRRVQLVGHVGVSSAGEEVEVARPGAGRGSDPRRGARGDPAGRSVEVVHHHLVQPQVRHQGVVVAGVDEERVRMGLLLPVLVHAGPFVLYGGHTLAHAAVAVQGEDGYAASSVVGHEQEAERLVEAEVARQPPSRLDAVQQGEPARFRIDVERADGPSRVLRPVPYLVDAVQPPAAGVEGEEAGVVWHAVRARYLQAARGGVESQGVDALARAGRLLVIVLLRICPDVDGQRACGCAHAFPLI